MSLFYKSKIHSFGTPSFFEKMLKKLKKSLTGKILVDIMRERAKIRKFFLCAKKFIHKDE